MQEKRPANGAGDDGHADATATTNGAAPAKKARLDDATAAPTVAALPAKPSISLEALQKAKKALEMQKQLMAKLQQQRAGLAQQAAAAAAVPSPAVPGTDHPASAQLVAAATAKAAQLAARFGRTIVPAPAAAPLLAPPALVAAALLTPATPATGRQGSGEGQQHHPGGTASVLPGTATTQQQQQQLQDQQPQDDRFFDPEMGNRGAKKLQRRARGTLEFVLEGEFQQQADEFRMQQRFSRGLPLFPKGPFGPLMPPPTATAAAIADDPNQVPLGSRPSTQEADQAGQEEEEEVQEALPAVEWWDRGLLPSASYERDVPSDASQPIPVKESRVTHYVEHPVPIEPPAEAPAPAPQPLKLTSKELKKLRTQRRQAREKEKQDLIRQGLLEPAKPKVKLSNLYRVLGEQAVLDPTAIEMETRKQMAERQAAHDDRNVARMLTPAEQRDKKLKKLFDPTGTEVITTVYRVQRLDNKLNLLKTQSGAKDNHMTGCLLLTPDFALVVVEGCGKATKRFNKLMLRRMDWSLARTQKEGEQQREGGERGEEEEEEQPNACHQVWQGLVKSACFKDFRTEDCRSVEHAKQVLAQHGVAHYWDSAVNFDPEDAPAVELV